MATTISIDDDDIVQMEIGDEIRATTFIDLTAEPDSPSGAQDFPIQLPARATSSRPTNPRRRQSVLVNGALYVPPRLERSDSNFIASANAAPFIDLTEDSPPRDESRQFGRATRASHAPGSNTDEAAAHTHDAPLRHEFFAIHRLLRGGNMISSLLNSLPAFQLDLTGTAFNFDSNDQTPPAPKSPMEEDMPTREGFTRQTGENTVAVCPSCGEELAYEPGVPANGTKKRTRGRASGEHHFWALKSCGHVYCANCYENRRSAKHPNLGFRFPSLGSSNNKVMCAVDDCTSEVGPKVNWVGIFL